MDTLHCVEAFATTFASYSEAKLGTQVAVRLAPEKKGIDVLNVYVCISPRWKFMRYGPWVLIDDRYKFTLASGTLGPLDSIRSQSSDICKAEEGRSATELRSSRELHRKLEGDSMCTLTQLLSVFPTRKSTQTFLSIFLLYWIPRFRTELWFGFLCQSWGKDCHYWRSFICAPILQTRFRVQNSFTTFHSCAK